MQTRGVFMGWQLLGSVGWMSSRTQVVLYGVCKAEQVCSLLWNPLSWCERVTLSVGFASLSSQKKKRKENMYFAISADGGLGGIKTKVKCISQATCGKHRRSFLKKILIKISAQLNPLGGLPQPPPPAQSSSPHLPGFIFLHSAYQYQNYPAYLFPSYCPSPPL